MLQRVIAWADEPSLVADGEPSTSPGQIAGALGTKEIFSG